MHSIESAPQLSLAGATFKFIFLSFILLIYITSLPVDQLILISVSFISALTSLHVSDQFCLLHYTYVEFNF